MKLWISTTHPMPDGDGYIVAKHAYDENTPVPRPPGSAIPEEPNLKAVRAYLSAYQLRMIETALDYIAVHGREAYIRTTRGNQDAALISETKP